MRPSLAPILTIFALLGTTLSNPLHPLQARRKSLDGDPPFNSSSSSTLPSTTPTTSTTPTSPIITSSPTFPPITPPLSSTDFSTSTFNDSSITSLSTDQSSQESTSTSKSRHSSFTTSTSNDLTSLDTSTDSTSTPSGPAFTVTAVVSRPPSDPGANSIGGGAVSTARQGFFANTGAVAGTFLVVGLIGAATLICVVLWLFRRYRRHKMDRGYFDADFKEFYPDGGRAITPEGTLPVTRGSTPVSLSPTPNMIERLHGTGNGYSDAVQYQGQPGEFDPYQAHGGAYAYSDDHANYVQYGQAITGP